MKTNYWAILVCAIVYWLIGALWYAVLFRAPWMALELANSQPSSRMNANAFVLNIAPYIITFLLNLLIAFVLAQICIWRNANTIGRGAAVGILLWIGFVGPITLTTQLYESRPMELYAINQFYPLVGLCVMGAILGAWVRKAAA